MNPYEIRETIIKLLLKKIKTGEEKNLTKEDVNSWPLLFSDNNGEIGFPSLTDHIENSLSERTIKELEGLRCYI